MASTSQQQQEQQPPGLTPDQVSLFTCLSAYTDALDALPLDLTRSFSDLRELDAVLGPHVASLVARIHQLTDVVTSASRGQLHQGAEISAGQRLLLLKECAEEARAYKMGGEDKIRVALNTCETILSHTDYIDAILDQLSSLPEIAAILEPSGGKRSHVAGELSDGTPITLASANAATLMAGGSGIFANTGSQAVAAAAAVAALSAGNASMATLAAQDGLSGVTVPTGKKSIGTGAGAAAKRKTDAAAAGGAASATASSSKAGAGGAGSGAVKKRKTAGDADGSKKGSAATGAASSSSGAASRKKASAAAGSPGSPALGGKRAADDDRASSAASSRAARAASELEEVRSSGTRSRPARAPRATGGSGLRRRLDDGDEDGDDGGDEGDGRGHSDEAGEDGRGEGSSSALGLSMGDKDEDSPGPAGRRFDSPRSSHQGGTGRNRKDDAKGRRGRATKGEGDDDVDDGASYAGSMAMSQSASQQHHSLSGHDSTLTSAASDRGLGGSAGDGSGAGEVDERRYCFCENVSYGDMIGCDDDGCTREWFHLECVGLKEPPSGTWYCDDCLERRGKRRGGKAKVVRSEGKWGGGGHEVSGGNGKSSKGGRR